ncbi:MAG: hypothetical protein M3Q39_15980 [Actinomycetota bacterium]|nr:hypothetical protein [Actinomycetota bacterium]
MTVPMESPDAAPRRAAAVETLAKEMYEHSVTRASPEWIDLSDTHRLHFREMANDAVNHVSSLVQPVQPDVEVLKMRVKFFADEIRQLECSHGFPFLPHACPASPVVIANALEAVLDYVECVED